MYFSSRVIWSDLELVLSLEGNGKSKCRISQMLGHSIHIYWYKLNASVVAYVRMKFLLHIWYSVHYTTLKSIVTYVKYVHVHKLDRTNNHVTYLH